VWIGKKGVTEELKSEIARHLKDHGLVKVKILDKTLDREEVARKVAGEVGGELIEVRGRTFILKSVDKD
jgi:RNA-binding protein